MKFIADLHIHSSHSRDTSPEMDLQSLYKWGQIKGIHLMATGDFTHPGWFNSISEKLEEAEPGLFRLKKELAAEIYDEIPTPCKSHLRFLLTAEVTCVFSRGEKARKIHLLIAVPSVEYAARLNGRLSEIGNIETDGSPVIPLDAVEMLKLVFDICPRAIFIPAHIWTPTYGLLGSSAGFDSIAECFGDFSPQITALETGISSDPEMNRRWSALDGFTLVSNSDAHSPAQLGREANVFDFDPSFDEVKKVIRSGDPQKFIGTVEMFPEAGKHHYDGHAACSISLAPDRSAALGGNCPRCGKKLTIGVQSRIQNLGDRPHGRLENKIPFRHLLPLREIIADLSAVDVSSKVVSEQYLKLVSGLGNEFHILLDAPVEDIKKASTGQLAEAITKMRQGKVLKISGYDGVPGSISILKENNTGQLALF